MLPERTDCAREGLRSSYSQGALRAAWLSFKFCLDRQRQNWRCVPMLLLSQIAKRVHSMQPKESLPHLSALRPCTSSCGLLWFCAPFDFAQLHLFEFAARTGLLMDICPGHDKTAGHRHSSVARIPFWPGYDTWSHQRQSARAPPPDSKSPPFVCFAASWKVNPSLAGLATPCCGTIHF